MICIRSGLEAIRVKRAREAVVKAVSTFDRTLAHTLEEVAVLSTQQTATAISGARDAAFHQFDDATQELPVRIVKEAREQLVHEISQKAGIVAQSQAEKCLELNGRIKEIVCEHIEGISQKAKAVPENHAGGNGVDGEWNQLVSSHFEILDRDIQKLVTVNDKANEALLAELTWAVSREVFENLLECGDSQNPGNEVVGWPDRAEIEKQLEIGLEKARHQGHETPQPGENVGVGGGWRPGAGTPPQNGSVFLDSQGQRVDGSSSQTTAAAMEGRESREYLDFETSHPGGNTYPGGILCRPGGERAPKGGVFHDSQGKRVDARGHAENPSSIDMHPGRRKSQPRLRFYRGDFCPGGGKAPKGWGYYNSQREWVDCNSSQKTAPMAREPSGQEDTNTFDGLHDDHPPAHAEGRGAPTEREQSQDEQSDSDSQQVGAFREQQDKPSSESTILGEKAVSQVEPPETQESEAGEVQRGSSTPKSNVARNEPSTSSAVKWVLLEHEAGELRTTEEAGGLLSAVHEDQAINVLTIVGAAKQGKSFLMNALTGSDNVFPVSPEPTACTAGADLSPILMPLPEFEQGGDGGVATSSSCQPHPTIAFVDMEGQGDKSPEHDVRLATPFLLVSKVVIYNWSGLPNKDTILQQLVVMLNAAERVTPAEEHEERTFGHLILVFRDVTGKAAGIEALVLGEEGTEKLKFTEQKHVSERNRIRQGLKAAFKSVAVHTMPNPHPNIGDGAVALSDVVPEFAASLDQLRSTLSEHLCTPHNFGGVDIAGGERLHAIVGGLCIAVDSTQNISPPSVLETIDTARAVQAIRQGLVHFDSMLASVFGGELVLSVQETDTAIRGAGSNAFETFGEMTKGMSDHIAAAHRQELETMISQKADVVARNQQERRHELDSTIHKLVCEHEEGVIEKAKALPVPMDGKVLDERWSHLVSSHFGVLEESILAMLTVNDVFSEALHGDLRWAISRTEFDELVKRTLESVRQLNAIATSGKNDREAKEETEKQMIQLAEQAETFILEGERALEEAKQAHQAAASTQAQAISEARQARREALIASRNDRSARERVERRMSQLTKEADVSKKQSESALAQANRVNEAAAQAQARASREAQQARQYAASVAERDRQDKAATATTITDLARQLDDLKRESKTALAKARQADEAAASARAQAAYHAEQAQSHATMMEWMHIGGGGGGGGGCYDEYSDEECYYDDRGCYDPCEEYDPCGGYRFYKGGQFVPGGGRAPKGGGYY